MTDQEKLTKIIERAVENGWKPMFLRVLQDGDYLMVEVNGDLLDVCTVIFEHNFCKCFFGGLGTSDIPQSHLDWQFHIQKLALSDNRIEYLWQFYNEEV